MKNYSFSSIPPTLLKTSCKVSPMLLLAQMFYPYLPARFQHFREMFPLFKTIISIVASLIGIQLNVWQLIEFILLQNSSLNALWHSVLANANPTMLLITLLASPFTIPVFKLGRDIYKIKDFSAGSVMNLIEAGIELL